MWTKISTILGISLLIISVECAQIPSTFKKCNRKQTDFNKCLLEAVTNALDQSTKPFKEIGLPILDPLEIPSLSVKPGNGPVGFTQDYKNVKFYGFSHANCDKVEMDFEKKIMKAHCIPPTIKMTFDYVFKGKILVITFTGKGPGNVNIVKPEVDMTFKLDEYTKNGAKHYKVIDSKFDMNPEKMVFDFKNLFEGDEKASENILNVFNENWKDLYADVGGDYEKIFGEVFKSIFNQILAKISIKDMFGEA